MIQILIVLTLFMPAHAGRGPKQGLEKERAAVTYLQDKFSQFRDSVAKADEKLFELRSAVKQGRKAKAEAITAEVGRLMGVARRRYTELDTFYTQEVQKKKLNLAKPNLLNSMETERDLMTYITFRRNDRFGTGSPMELLMMAYRGLEVGIRMEEPSSDLIEARIGSFDIYPGDSLLLIARNGGLIRGRFEGRYRGSWFVREVLPITLGRGEGRYREVNLNRDIARVEVIHASAGATQSDSPTSVLSYDGRYSEYQVRPNHVWRFELKPTDTELFELVRAGRFKETQDMKITSTQVDLTESDFPAYGELYFMDCSSLL